MKTRVKQLKELYTKNYGVMGDQFIKCMEGFAMILDDNQDKNETIDLDLIDVQMILGMNNGTTIQLTGQITDIKAGLADDLDADCYIKISISDKRNNIAPNAVYIFNPYNIDSIQSYDIVAYLKNKEKQDALNVLYPLKNESVSNTLIEEPSIEAEKEKDESDKTI